MDLLLYLNIQFIDMKTLYVVRHAKSSWDNLGEPDQKRPLNERGKKDAPEMAKKLKKKAEEIDVFISSPAKRARQTAKHFIKEFGGTKKDILKDDRLYPGETHQYYEVINDIKDKHKSAALFAHNPAITDFVNTLTEHRIDEMPTCSVFAVKADINSWKEFKDAKKELVLFDFPKKGE
jgi:phosphohistidine phosphatase